MIDCAFNRGRRDNTVYLPTYTAAPLWNWNNRDSDHFSVIKACTYYGNETYSFQRLSKDLTIK